MNTITYSSILEQIDKSRLSAWGSVLPDKIKHAIYDSGHGDLAAWLTALGSLPSLHSTSSECSDGYVRIGDHESVTDSVRTEIERVLRAFMPWRKGPFDVHGIQIETEWRSDLKWDRLIDHIAPLNNRIILDVGCGNGYHLWRMCSEGARLALGVDSTLLYTFQYLVLHHFMPSVPLAVFPFALEEMEDVPAAFDTLFSMGVLYHARSPIDHILALHKLLRPGGELVLETLVIEGEKGAFLMPEDRYAKMRNVWFVPSVETMEQWLMRCKFKNVRCVDVTKTTSREQRITDWMEFESLADFLDPDDENKTIEGYPAPVRAIFVANK